MHRRWIACPTKQNLPQKRKRKKSDEKRKREPNNAEPTEDGQTYGIDLLNIGETAQDLDSDYKWLLAQLRKTQKSQYKY